MTWLRWLAGAQISRTPTCASCPTDTHRGNRGCCVSSLGHQPDRATIRGMWRLICLSVVLCAGCTKFDHPVVDAGRPAVDPGLLGKWVFENEEGRYELTVHSDHGVGVITTTDPSSGVNDRAARRDLDERWIFRRPPAG